jgi:hypothetical protein
MDLCSALGAVLRAEIFNCVGNCGMLLIGRMETADCIRYC